jgi:glycosyltransferase involved in cell wall biosynthesis
LPILSTPVSAIPEFIKTGVHGTLIDDTPQAIAEAIQTLAAAPENAAEMAEAALKRLKTEFAMQPGIDQLADLLREMAEAQR